MTQLGTEESYGPVVDIDEAEDIDDEEQDLLPGYPEDDSHRYNLISSI